MAKTTEKDFKELLRQTAEAADQIVGGQVESVKLFPLSTGEVSCKLQVRGEGEYRAFYLPPKSG